MKTGLLRKLTVAGIAMLMLIALTSGIGQARIASTFSIKYNSNYRGGPAEVTDYVVPGNNYKIDIPLSFTRSGYKLEYFTTQPDGGGTVYKIGYTFVPTGNLTLYAKWS